VKGTKEREEDGSHLGHNTPHKQQSFSLDSGEEKGEGPLGQVQLNGRGRPQRRYLLVILTMILPEREEPAAATLAFSDPY
jgi:hypothetical protein